MRDHKLRELLYFLAKLKFIYPLNCSLQIPAALPLAEALSVCLSWALLFAELLNHGSIQKINMGALPTHSPEKTVQKE
jgi:hypothetical protein